MLGIYLRMCLCVSVCAYIIYYNNQTKQYEIFVLNLLKTILTFSLLSSIVHHADSLISLYTYICTLTRCHCLFHFELNDLQMLGD